MSAAAKDYGRETLEVLEGFDAYAGWIYKRIKPYLGQRVMEIGSGIGNNVNHLLSTAESKVMLADYRQDYVDTLTAKHGSNPNVSVHLWDATTPAPPELAAEPPDTVVLLNVLEHIKEDRLALKNIHGLLPAGGRLVVLVPAHQALYSAIDRNLEHHLRYNKAQLTERFTTAGYEVSESFYFNAVGALGWFVAGRVLRAEQINGGHVGLQKLLFPVSKAVDALKPPFGLSVVCVGRKPA